MSNTDTYIQSFEELKRNQQRSAGGKGAMLARLYQNGHPVPDGFIIMSHAFEGDDLKDEVWGPVQARLTLLRHHRDDAAFAVRSSASSEDSAQASFAGEFETVMDARDDDEIRQAIQKVRRSRSSDRVQAYSAAKGMEATHEIAVVIQQMVPAEISGVLFTADPVSGSRSKMVGNYVHGLGDQLVSGEASGEAFSISRPGGGYEGPGELKRYALRLYKLGTRLEKELSGPQDVEWAVAGGKLYVLQSRPVTTLLGCNPTTGEINDSLTGDYLWSNVNFGEAVTEVMTPLSWTVLKLILEEWVFVPGYASVGNIGGRPYLNISAFASAFFASGKSRHDFLETLEGTLHMQLPEEMKIPVIPLSRRSKLAVLFNLVRLQGRQKRAMQRLPAYLQTNLTWFSKMRLQIKKAETKAALLSLWHEQIKPHVTQSVWGVLGSAISSSDCAIQLRRDLAKLVGPEDADTLISNLSDHSGMLASLGMVVGIAKVASGELPRQEYLEQYGHRGPHEFELSAPRPAENPEWLDQQVARFAKSPVDVEALLTKQRSEFNAAWKRFEIRYPSKKKSMRRRIDEMGRRARRREDGRSEYTRDRWLMRLFALRAGELTDLFDDIFFLTFDEVMSALSGDETAAKYIAARKQTYKEYKSLPPYPSVIRGRFDPFRWAADPKRRSDFYDAYSPSPSMALEGRSSNLIFGAPGAAGRVEAIVRRLDDPADGDCFRAGEVLVTTQTDIAWTLLFPRAAAIITDVGAPLSHAAIVARELGIPAVVGCGDATMRLRTGDRVRVDGTKGSVEILEVYS